MGAKPPRKRAGQATGRRHFAGELRDVGTQSREWGITEKALRAQVARGLIPYRRLGGRIVFVTTEMAEFVRQLPGVTAAEALANVAARNGQEATK